MIYLFTCEWNFDFILNGESKFLNLRLFNRQLFRSPTASESETAVLEFPKAFRNCEIAVLASGLFLSDSETFVSTSETAVQNHF